jgi:sialidase-1
VHVALLLFSSRAALSVMCVVLLLSTSLFPIPLDGQDLSAKVERPVHPILIRNEHAPSLRLLIDVPQERQFVLTSIIVSLSGSDDPSDIEKVTLFATGNNESFSADKTFGAASQPADEITFRGEHPLQAGKNFFWVSCQLKNSANLLHRITVSCVSINTSAGKIVPRDESPAYRHRIGIALRKHNDDGVNTYRIPAMTTTPRGTLLCVYDMRRRMSRDLQEDIDTGLSRSTDGGASWEPVRLIMDMGEYGGLPLRRSAPGRKWL